VNWSDCSTWILYVKYVQWVYSHVLMCVHVMMAYVSDVLSHSFLTEPLGGSDCSANPAHLALVFMERKAELAPERVWTFWWRQTILAPVGNRTTVLRLSKLLPSQYTDWGIPAPFTCINNNVRSKREERNVAISDVVKCSEHRVGDKWMKYVVASKCSQNHFIS